MKHLLSRKFITANGGVLAIALIVLLSKLGVSGDVCMAAIAGIATIVGAYIGGNVAAKKYGPDPAVEVPNQVQGNEPKP